MIPKEVGNVVPMVAEEEMNATFEVDPTDGGVIVDFSEEETARMSPSEAIEEWYGNLTDTIEQEELDDIANNVINSFQADKDSRAEWESTFDRDWETIYNIISYII